MEINLRVELPSPYSEVEKLKEVIFEEEVAAYSIDKNFMIVEGKGKIANDGRYNYHNNYDNSEDVMVFNGEHKWFSLSKARVKKLQRELCTKAIVDLTNIANMLEIASNE